MRRIGIIFFLLFFVLSIQTQQQYRKPVKKVKNIVVMIADGTSTSVLSAARWYQIYNRLGGDKLHIDPHLCGLVKTYQSNAPIPDSAPAMSAFTTGVPTQAGYLALYPPTDPIEDIYPIDETRTYQPLATVMEASKIEQQKAIGVVVTVDFCHATPAACISHYYKRSAYPFIATQFAYNDMDVVFGGGAKVVTDEMKEYFATNGTQYLEKDLSAFNNYKGEEKLWALFSEGYLPYDLDRDPEQIPSLSDMTEKALLRLSKDENGFFLMVEGSQIDAAAHSTDPIGIITEFLAFDKAVGKVLDFAKKDGETAVIIMSDHGTSGFSFGSKDFKRYTYKGLDHSFEAVSKFKKTAKGLEEILLKTASNDIKSTFKRYTDIDITDEELSRLLSSKNYKTPDYTQVGNTVNMISTIANIMTSRTYFEFISGAHTGEDVFLAAYHPHGDLPYGLNTNIEINQYLCDLLGLERPLTALTKEIFAKHTDVFKDLDYSIDESDINCPTLIVRKGTKELKIPAFRSIAYLNSDKIFIGSSVIYIDKNKTFYLPQKLRDIL